MKMIENKIIIKPLHLLGFLPGLNSLILGKYLSGLLRLIFFIFGVVIALDLLGLISALFLGVCMSLSSYYCQLYQTYEDSQKEFLNNSDTKMKLDIAHNLLYAPNWWIPIINLPYAVIIPILLCIYLLLIETRFSLHGIMQGLPVAFELIDGMLTPNWALLPEAIKIYAKQTLEIALLGSIGAFFFSLPISILCSWNLMSMHPATKAFYYSARLIMVLVRAVPTFLLGLIFVALVGLGPFPGVLAIFIFSIGIMVKLFSEAIENIDFGPLEAVQGCGGNGINIAMFAVFPQVTPMIIAQSLYCVEINIHSATVLGLIGAEGIGLPIHEYLSALSYSNAAVFIFVTIFMTVGIDYTSAYLRNKVIGGVG